VVAGGEPVDLQGEGPASLEDSYTNTSPIAPDIDTTFTKVFVGGLPWSTTSEGLCSYFTQFGDIVEAAVIRDRHTGKSKGYGFVTFSDKDTAQDSIADPSPIIDGRKANCNLAAFGKKRDKSEPKSTKSGGRGKNKRHESAQGQEYYPHMLTLGGHGGYGYPREAIYMEGMHNMGHHGGMPHQMGYPHPSGARESGQLSPQMFRQRGDPYNMMHYNDYASSDMAHYPGPSQLQAGYHQMAQGYPLAYGMHMSQQMMYGHMQMPDGSTFMVPNRGTYMQQGARGAYMQQGASPMSAALVGGEHALKAEPVYESEETGDKSITNMFEQFSIEGSSAVDLPK